VIQLLLRAAFTGTSPSDEPVKFSPHDFRRIFATEAMMNGMPPHIAQLLLGHKDINVTMGYKAVYPEEAISGHRAFKGWTGEAEGLKVSLAAADTKLAQIDTRTARRADAVHLGMPAYHDIAGRTATISQEA
jgi:hypothetical protein